MGTCAEQNLSLVLRRIGLPIRFPSRCKGSAKAAKGSRRVPLYSLLDGYMDPWEKFGVEFRAQSLFGFRVYGREPRF